MLTLIVEIAEKMRSKPKDKRKSQILHNFINLPTNPQNDACQH